MNDSDLDNRRKISASLLALTTNNQDNLVSPITFKILVASRPDPSTKLVSDQCIQMKFESQTDEDIKFYVEKSLASLR